jgi:hypothetical protein
MNETVLILQEPPLAHIEMGVDTISSNLLIHQASLECLYV